MSESFDPYYTWLGIPPQQQPPNHYRLLGIESFEGSPDVIERAADRRMADLRTYQTGKHSADSQRLLNEVAAAKLCLLDAKKKARYDAALREKLAAAQSEAVGADVFTSLVEGTPAGALTAPIRKAKPKHNVAMIGGLAAAGVGAVLIAAWALFWGGTGVSPVPGPATGKSTVAWADSPDKQSLPSPPAPLPQAGEGSEETAPKRANELGAPKGAEPPEDFRGVNPPASEPTKKVDAPAPPAVAAKASSAEPPPKPAEEAEKHPIPSAEVQRDVGSTIEETYKISEAKTPEAKLKLARQLSEAAKKTARPEEQYVLLRNAVDLACDGGAAVLMLETLARMIEAFAVEPFAAKAALLDRFAKGPRSPARVQSLVEGSRGVIEEALDEDRYEIASTVAKTVADACSRSSPALRKESAEQRKRVQQLQAQFEEVQKALETLRARPEDAEANLAAGSWYSFVKDDWKTGLAHLAKGSDPLLKSLADRELSSPPATPEDQLKLADAWWDAAAEHRGEEKTAMLRCAGRWYEQATGQLQGINKTKAEKRLSQIAEIAQDSPTRPGREPPPAIAPFDAKRARAYQLQWARYLRVPVEFTNSIGMQFVLIPPGEFDMGSTEQEVARWIKEGRQWGAPEWAYATFPSEVPKHRVRITRAFYLSLCEVTQAQYSQAMGSNPSRFKDAGPDAPVEQVSWDNAVAFCRRLSALRVDKIVPGEYRLPTEAEWEYAARAGTAAACFFGDDPAALSDYAWCHRNSGGKTHPVGQKRPNPFGLYDVLGNVWEWCADAFSPDYYRQSPPADPPGPATGNGRAVRGESWIVDPVDVCIRSAFRINAPQDFASLYGGFRVVRGLPAKAVKK